MTLHHQWLILSPPHIVGAHSALSGTLSGLGFVRFSVLRKRAELSELDQS